jgi:hypothetical protein
MRTECPSCYSTNFLGTNRALIAPWVRELTGLKSRSALYHLCADCSLGWVDVAYPQTVLDRLYAEYRKARYFAVRNSWESTYTESLNSSLDYGEDFLRYRREYITNMISRVDANFIKSAKGVVDIGGGHGGVIPDWPHLQAKFVLEVSDAEPEEGITSVSGWENIPKSTSIDLIMACGILEHLNSPSEFLKSLSNSAFSHKGAVNQFFYFEVPYGHPSLRKNRLYPAIYAFALSKVTWRIFDKTEKLKRSLEVPIRIAEHLQFFNEESMSSLLKNNGFKIFLIEKYDSVSNLSNSKGLNFQSGLAVLATRI